MENQKIYLAWLYTIPGIGGKTIQKLIQEVSTCSQNLPVEETARRIYQLPTERLEALLSPSQLHAFLAARKSQRPYKQWEELNRRGITLLPLQEDTYPPALKNIPDPPAALFVKGSLPVPSLPPIAVIGARLCSDYGRYEARQFGIALARAGVQIISGMALGIDGIAQANALEAGGKTFAVLGCGVDVCYPPENKSLYDAIPSQGGLLSEYKPGTAPRSILFPQRNRIISGLSDLILVIEARQKSGTFITVDQALEQGKEVYALPGRICDRLSDGCNDLIRQGAGIATSPEDLLRDLYEIRKKKSATEEGTSSPRKETKTNAVWCKRQPPQKDPSIAPAKQPALSCESTKQKEPSFTEPEQRVFALLEPSLQSVSVLEEKINRQQNEMTAAELMTHLVHLVLKGLAEQEGNSFRKR